MSYLFYLNGNLIELSPEKPVTQTKQVNDIARLDKRETNYTNKFIAPLTANNLLAMENVYLTGNQSNIPYSRMVADLIDADSGVHLIYKGWANVKITTDKGYEIFVYDGIIDFYRAIENKSLTDIDVTALNHLKNVQTVVDTFTIPLPYKYLIGDYNGNNAGVISTGGDFIPLLINIDYQVPSVRNSWLWNRIFEFIGWTYSGSVFATDDFLNFFMTFPKPVPQSVPITTLMSQQYSEILTNTVLAPGPTPGSLEYVTYYYALIFANSFTSAFGHKDPAGPMIIDVTGSYVLRASGEFCGFGGCSSVLNWEVRSAAGAVLSTGTCDFADEEFCIIPAVATNRLYINTPITGITNSVVNFPMTGSMEYSLGHLDGFDANFSEVLVDFKVTDYVNEIMQRYGLTAFKDRFTNHIEFLTIKEIIQNEAEDWSRYSPKKKGERYVYGNYAKRNWFKYRYNEQNDKHHDWYIDVVDENLNDELTVVPSRVYAPDKREFSMFGSCKGVFRMWNKEVEEQNNDDEDDTVINVKYKDLSGRYYFLREEPFTFPPLGFDVEIGSIALNTHQVITDFPVVSYTRMPFVNVIEDNYSFLNSMLNKAKVLDMEFKLTSAKVATFDFKRLIYIEQNGSFYLVNKIKGFTKDKATICEVVEVDIDNTSFVEPPPPVNYLTLLSFAIVGCDIIVEVDTNIEQPATVSLLFEIPPLVPGSPGVYHSLPGILDGDTITVSLDSLPGNPINYSMTGIYISPLYIQSTSNTLAVNIDGSCYVSGGHLEAISYTRDPGEDMIVEIDTDIPYPFEISLTGGRVYPTFDFFMAITVVATSSTVHFPGVPAGAWNFTMQAGTVTSNTF